MEQAIRDARSINAHPEHLVPGWIKMDRPHLMFQLDSQTTVFVDPFVLNNFIQSATPLEKAATQTELLQLATNSQAVQRIASNLTPVLGSNKARSSALQISSFFLSDLVHQCFDLYAREQANVSRLLNATGLSSTQDLSQQLAAGHAKIDGFFNTNQAYRYDPEYKPFLQVASGEIPFLPSKGTATLVGRVQQLISLERRMAAAGSVATGALESRAVVNTERTLANRVHIDKALQLEKRVSEWLGEGVNFFRNRAGDPVFLSKDGQRKVRFDFNRPHPHESPHIHMEHLVDGEWQAISRIYPIDVPHQ